MQPLTFGGITLEAKLVAGEQEAAPDPVLRRALARAHRWTTDLRRGIPLAEVARRDHHSESYIRVRAPLAFLSPKIQAAIIAGTQPPSHCLADFVRSGVPLDWAAQDQLYGFAGKNPVSL